MSSTLYEIVELSGGDVVLQRADGDGQPLVRIKFSSEAQSHIHGACVEVARAMIEAGIEAASEMFDEGQLEAEFDAPDNESAPRRLH